MSLKGVKVGDTLAVTRYGNLHSLVKVAKTTKDHAVTATGSKYRIACGRGVASHLRANIATADDFLTDDLIRAGERLKKVAVTKDNLPIVLNFLLALQGKTDGEPK